MGRAPGGTQANLGRAPREPGMVAPSCDPRGPGESPARHAHAAMPRGHEAAPDRRWREPETTKRPRAIAGPKRPQARERSRARKKEQARDDSRACGKNPGSVLLSHRVAPAVPSALESLTSVFGMGTGVASPELPPGKTKPKHERECARLDRLEPRLDTVPGRRPGHIDLTHLPARDERLAPSCVSGAAAPRQRFRGKI